jgi:PAS domain S-box-containing protein
MSKRPLRILYTGNAEGIKQTQLVIQAKFASSESRYTDTPNGLLTEIDLFRPEIVIASYLENDPLTISIFSILFQEPLPIPILLVLPAAFEDLAIELMDRGAADYFFLENLKRLPYSVRNLGEKYRLDMSNYQKYGYLINQSLAGLYTISSTGELLDCNNVFAKLLGYTDRGELIGMKAAALYPSLAARDMLVEDLRKHRILNDHESILLRKDGSLLYLLENIYLANDPTSGEEHQQSIMVDVTQLVLTKQHIARARTMLTEAQNLAKMGNWNYNMRKGEFTVSLGLKMICGMPADSSYSVAEFLGLIEENDLERIRNEIKSLQEKGGKIENTFYFALKDGKRVKVKGLHTLDFDEDGKVLRFYGVIQDITELDVAEKERNRTTEELIKRNKALEQFTYVISHNLRAPVANIQALTDILKASEIGSPFQDLVAKIDRSVQNLDSVITDLNQILQIKHQQHSLKEQVNLHELMSSIQLSIKNVIVQENVRIIIDVGKQLSINTIRGYLYSIFYNLTLNSIKYRRADLNPIINISCRVADQQIIINFQDNSKGIDLDKNGTSLFGLYKRFDTSVEGKGMGLFMVKTQVEEIGGSIEVQSTLGTGTLFKIILPILPD